VRLSKQSLLMQIRQTFVGRNGSIVSAVADGKLNQAALAQKSEVVVNLRRCTTANKLLRATTTQSNFIGDSKQQFFGVFLKRFRDCWRRCRLYALYMFCELFDFSFKWVYLRLKLQVLRIERSYLSFQLLKLTVQCEYLSLVLLTKRQAVGIQKVEDSSHV
jgi:hypothetical protein